MPVSKKRKNARKVAKRYTYVNFTSELFEDDFTLPDQSHFSLGLMEAINAGNMGKLIAWLEAAKVDADQVDAIRDLDADEFEQFLEEWGKGSVVDLPKS